LFENKNQKKIRILKNIKKKKKILNIRINLKVRILSILWSLIGFYGILIFK